MLSVCLFVLCVFVCSCVCCLTYEHREEENGNRDVEDGTSDVKEPVRSHREETKEKEEEEQTATIFFSLTEEEKEEGIREKGRDGEKNDGKS